MTTEPRPSEKLKDASETLVASVYRLRGAFAQEKALREKAEAACAGMREKFQEMIKSTHGGDDCREIAKEAIAPDIGHTLLARLRKAESERDSLRTEVVRLKAEKREAVAKAWEDAAKKADDYYQSCGLSLMTEVHEIFKAEARRAREE